MSATAVQKEKRQHGVGAVPLFTFSDAVANLVPLASKARAANGLSWAGIMFAARCEANGDSGERCNSRRESRGREREENGAAKRPDQGVGKGDVQSIRLSVTSVFAYNVSTCVWEFQK